MVQLILEGDIMMFEYSLTEVEKVKTGYFESNQPLRLRLFPPKQKKKYIVLSIIMTQIEDKVYSEKEMNEVLEEIYPDFVTIRRALIDYKFMERTKDGKQYWITK